MAKLISRLYGTKTNMTLKIVLKPISANFELHNFRPRKTLKPTKIHKICKIYFIFITNKNYEPQTSS